MPSFGNGLIQVGELKYALVKKVWVQINKLVKAIVKIFDCGGEFVVGCVILKAEVPTGAGFGFQGRIADDRIPKAG